MERVEGWLSTPASQWPRRWPRPTPEASSTETSTHGSLCSAQGYRRAAGEDGGGGDNFRLIQTLLLGRYFAQVESARWSEGRYRLHVEAVP